jgi:RNA ligase (TIGR02306 family)
MTFECVESVRPHPNADRLDIVRVAGYEAIVGRGVYQVGSKCFLVHPDASLPADREWAQEYLSFVSSTTRRVKAKNIRGEWSFGLVVPFNKVSSDPSCYALFTDHWWSTDPKYPKAGTEVSASFGVTKYEAPLPTDLTVKGPLPFCLMPTDEDRYQNLGEAQVLGQVCTVTEKIDGTSLTVYCVLPGHRGYVLAEGGTEDRPILGYCARNNELKIPGVGETNRYWDAVKSSNIFKMLEDYCVKTGKSLAIRGEVHGPGIQSGKYNPWSQREKSVSWFSLLDLRTLEYLPFESLLDIEDIRTVPYLSCNTVITAEFLRKIETSKTLAEALSATKEEELLAPEYNFEMFEGVVCQYVDENGKVRSFKVMNKVYDEAK